MAEAQAAKDKISEKIKDVKKAKEDITHKLEKLKKEKNKKHWDVNDAFDAWWECSLIYDVNGGNFF